MQDLSADPTASLTADDDLGLMSEINVTPFIDVMLVLLIIFMVTAPMMIACIPLNLPKGSTSRLDKADKPLVVSLDLESRVYVGEDEIAGSDRMTRFKQLALDSADGGVYLRADKEIQYGKMVELMSELGEAGFARVTLVTEAKGPEVNAPGSGGDEKARTSGTTVQESR